MAHQVNLGWTRNGATPLFDQGYKGGNRASGAPAGFVQFASGYYELSSLNKRIIHPRPSAETSSWAVSKLTYPGIKWRIPVEVTGLSKPVHFSVSGPDGMAFSQSFPTLDSGTGEYVDSQEVGMLEWDNPTAGSHEYTITCQGQGGVSELLTVTTTLTVSTSGIGFVSTTGNDANPGTLASPKLTIEAFNDGNFGNFQVIARAGTYTPAANFITQGATQPKVLKGYPGETVTYDGTSSVFLIDAGDDISVSNINFVNSDQTIPYSRFIYGTTNFTGNRFSVFDASFSNFDIGTAGDNDNPGPVTFLAAGEFKDDFVFRNLNFDNITNDTSSSASGSLYQIRNAVANWITFGATMNAGRGFFLKSDCQNFAIHNVLSPNNNLNSGAVAVALGGSSGFGNDLIEISYCKLEADVATDSYAIRHQQSTSDDGTPRIYIFRNNIKGRVGYGGSTVIPSTVTVNKNIIISDQVVDPVQDSAGAITVIEQNNVIGDSADNYLSASEEALSSVDYTLGQRGANFYSGV